MNNIASYIFKIAVRNKIFISIYMLLVVGAFISSFLGRTMIVEQSQFAIIFFANFARLLINFGLISFITINICNLYNNKEIELILSKNVSKTKFVFSYYFAIIMLAFMLVIPLFIMLEIFQVAFGAPIKLGGLAVWSISLFSEIVIISTFTFFISLFIRSNITTILISTSFYILCRLYGFFLYSINNPNSITNSDALTLIMGKVLKFIGIFFPRLDLLNQSEWLIHSDVILEKYPIVVLNCFLSSFFILLLSVYEFNRREL